MTKVVKSSLEDRIAAAFSSGTQSEDVAALIREVDAAALTISEVADRAKERALDPTLSAADVAAARNAMEDAAFRRDRIKMALARLGDRLKGLQDQEEEQRRWAAYEKASAERNQLAAQLKELYPSFESRLSELLARIEENDREITRINTQAKPEGAPGLAGAELVARGLTAYFVGVNQIPRITRDLRLPAFEYHPNDDYAWPRK